MKSLPVTDRKPTPASPATARANSVLPVPGGPTSSMPFGHAGADLAEALGHAQEVDDFGDLLLDAFVAGDVGERGATACRPEYALARLRPMDMTLPIWPWRPLVHPHQEADDEDERQQQADPAEQPVAVGVLAFDVDALAPEQFPGRSRVGEVVAHRGGELRRRLQFASDGVGAVGDDDVLTPCRLRTSVTNSV